MDIHGNNLVNTISTKPLCASWSNLADMLAMVRGWTLLLLKMDPINFGGQRSKVKVTMDIHGNNLVNTISTKPLCASWSNLADMLAMVRGWTLLLLKMDPFDFRGQRSKFKVTMDIHGNNLVNTISTKPLCASWSNLADMLAMVRGWTLLLLKIRGQRSRSQWTYMEIILWTR